MGNLRATAPLRSRLGKTGAVLRLGAFVFGCAAIVTAQDAVPVPLSSPSQPAKIMVRTINGNITVTPGSGGQVVVESQGRERERSRDNPPPGMHRIDGGGGGMNVEEDHNTVTIAETRPGGPNGSLAIQAPVNTSVEIRTVNGHIDVSGINGDIEVENTNSAITLTDVSGSVVAHTLNGRITATLNRVAPGKPMSFTSLNGRIDVTLPADTKARFRLKTDNGRIYTDFDVKMEADTGSPAVEDNRGQGGKYRIVLDRSISGTINGGGPEYTFQTFNGSIYIHRK